MWKGRWAPDGTSLEGGLYQSWLAMGWKYVLDPKYDADAVKKVRRGAVPANSPPANATVANASLIYFGPAHTVLSVKDEGRRIGWASGLANSIGGPKSTQLATREQTARACGCTWDSMRIAPQTFIVDQPQEAERWLALQASEEGRMLSWIAKPHRGFRGSNMSVHLQGSASQLTAEVFEATYRGRPFVIQRYIDRPPLACLALPYLCC